MWEWVIGATKNPREDENVSVSCAFANCARAY